MTYTLYTIGSLLFILLFIICGYGVSNYIHNKSVWTLKCGCGEDHFEETEENYICITCGKHYKK